MSRNRDKSEADHLKGIIRALKAEVRHLKKELNRQDKKVRQYETHIELVEPEMVEEPIKSDLCPDCNKGKLKFSDVGIRLLISCSNCNYRIAKKK